MKKSLIETAIFKVNATVLGREDLEFWVNDVQLTLARKQLNTWDRLIEGMQLHSLEMIYSDHEDILQAVDDLDAEGLRDIRFKLFVDSFYNDVLAFAPVIVDLTPANEAAEELQKIAKRLAEAEDLFRA